MHQPETSRYKGKAKETLTRSSTHSWSEPPAYQPPGPSPPYPVTTHEDAAHARALQAKLDSERASYDLARQLQEQEDVTVQEHRQLVREAARVKVFDCVICMEKYTEDYSAPVRGCGHALCRTCMKEHVQSQVDQAVWPIRCPTCVADPRTDRHGGEHVPTPPFIYVEGLLNIVLLVITRDLVETLGIDEAVLVKWVKLEMDKVSVAVECPR